jgi:hypothetical protein
MGRSVDHRQRLGTCFGSGLASDRRRRHGVLPGHRRACQGEEKRFCWEA